MRASAEMRRRRVLAHFGNAIEHFRTLLVRGSKRRREAVDHARRRRDVQRGLFLAVLRGGDEPKSNGQVIIESFHAHVLPPRKFL